MNHRFRALIGAALIATAGIAAHVGTSARAQESGFLWKRFNIYIGTTTGGGYDAYARLLARYIGNYLPGNPTPTPINRPGAGGLAMMNQLYANATRDGAEVGVAAPGFAIDHVVYGDQSKAQFDPTQFNWIGSMAKDPSAFIAWKSKGFSLNDVLTGKRMTVGMPGPGGSPWFYSRLLNALYGAKLNVVSGYPGIAEVLLAIENGELDGVAGTTWYGLKAVRERWFTRGEAEALVQYGKQRLPDLPDVPTLLELTNNDEARAILEVVASLDEIIRPVFAPPGVPPERVTTLRRAFDRAMQDPELLEEARAQNFPIVPTTGEAMQNIIARIANPPAPIMAKMREIYAQ